MHIQQRENVKVYDYLVLRSFSFSSPQYKDLITLMASLRRNGNLAAPAVLIIGSFRISTPIIIRYDTISLPST